MWSGKEILPACWGQNMQHAQAVSKMPDQYFGWNIARAIGNAIDRVSYIGGYLSATIVVGTAVSIAYEILARAFFGAPTKWMVEYSVYGVIASAFLGAAYLERENRHISMDLIVAQLSDKARAALDFFNHILGTIVCGILAVYSIRMVTKSIRYSIASVSILETPMYIPESAMTVGVILLTLQFLKCTFDKGVLMSRIEKEEIKKNRLERYANNPWMLVSCIAVLGIISVVLMTQTSSLQTVGLTVLLLVLFASGMPIFLALLLLGSIGFFVLMGGRISSQQILATLSYKALDSFTITAIPLFILGSGLLASSGISEKLFDICRAWLSRLHGNLTIATIVACAIFAAICGSSVATAGAIGAIAIPAMLKRNYDEGLAIGSVAAGGTLGIIIPPSLQMLLYGAITETSVGQLFIAGILPGILITVLFLAYIFIKCRGDVRYKEVKVTTWKEKWLSLKQGMLILPAPIVVICGIYSGVFTPTEAAGVFVIYAIIVILVSRSMNWRQAITATMDSIKTSVMVLLIIVGAVAFGGVVTMLRLPHDFTNFVVALPIPSWAVIVALSILVLILGMFIECVSITLITVPILFPAIIALGYDPIWFGVLLTVNMELALITPPVGLNLYVLKGISDSNFEAILKGVVPFVIILVIALVVIGVFEPLSTWLPSKMMR